MEIKDREIAKKQMKDVRENLNYNTELVEVIITPKQKVESSRVFKITEEDKFSEKDTKCGWSSIRIPFQLGEVSVIVGKPPFYINE